MLLTSSASTVYDHVDGIGLPWRVLIATHIRTRGPGLRGSEARANEIYPGVSVLVLRAAIDRCISMHVRASVVHARMLAFRNTTCSSCRQSDLLGPAAAYEPEIRDGMSFIRHAIGWLLNRIQCFNISAITL